MGGGRRLHGRVEKTHAVAPGGLGLVHGQVSLLEQLANEKALDKVEGDIKTALEDFKSSWK
jgi:hypothetical protein